MILRTCSLNLSQTKPNLEACSRQQCRAAPTGGGDVGGGRAQGGGGAGLHQPVLTGMAVNGEVGVYRKQLARARAWCELSLANLANALGRSRWKNDRPSNNKAYEPTLREHVANILTHGVSLPSPSQAPPDMLGYRAGPGHPLLLAGLPDGAGQQRPDPALRRLHLRRRPHRPLHCLHPLPHRGSCQQQRVRMVNLFADNDVCLVMNTVSDVGETCCTAVTAP